MLKQTHVRPFVQVVQDPSPHLEVAFLEDPRGAVVPFLNRMGRLVRKLEGRPRSTVVEALRRQERRVRDTRRLAGISKTLLDRCTFRPPQGAERAEAIREALFRARGERWPPTPGDLRAPYRDAAQSLQMPEERVDALLFADRPEAHLLVRAPRFDGARHLDLYNLDLARAVLLDAVQVTLEARGGWKAIFRAVKLARLMYRIEATAGAGRYRVELTGPAASFVVRARRYGFRFARVVPALTQAPGWSLDAVVEWEGGRLPFHLDGSAPVAGSRGRGRPRHDSGFERSLARDFAEKLGDEREGWTLHREGTPLPMGEELFLPDFTFRHRDGREALVEIVGFWTREYLETKLRKVRAAGLEHLILVVYAALEAGEGELEATAPGRVLRFVRKPQIGQVMEAVEAVAVRPDGAQGPTSS